MLFSRLLIAFSAAAVALSTPTKRTAADIESTLADLTQKVNALDTACKNLPASATVAQVYNIHSQAVAVGNSLQTGTTAVHNTAGPLAKADCDAIFSSVHALGGPISDTLSQIVAKYAVFKAVSGLDVIPLVHGDLVGLDGETNAYFAGLVKICPSSAYALQSDGAALDKAFKVAEAKYA